MSEAEAIEAVARAIWEAGGGGLIMDEHVEPLIAEAQAALSAAKPFIEKALLRKLMKRAGKQPKPNFAPIIELFLKGSARDLGYDIGE